MQSPAIQTAAPNVETESTMQQLQGIQLLHAHPNETQLLLQMGKTQAVLTVNLVAESTHLSPLNSGGPINQLNATRLNTTQLSATQDEIYTYIEQALKDYTSPPRLSSNPLVGLLQLKSCKVPPHLPNVYGILLKLWLDYAIDTVCKVSAERTISEREWRLHHYLHLRYREHHRHLRLAEKFGYTERHLGRFRQEQIAEVAELIFT